MSAPSVRIIYGHTVLRHQSCGVLTKGTNHYQEKYGMPVGTAMTWAIKFGAALVYIGLLATLALCLVTLAHAGPSIQLGKSTRVGDIETALTVPLYRSLNAQLEYIDEGQQPYPIANINRVINLDVQYVYSVTYRLALTGKLGLTCSRLSYNGSGIDYQNNTGFTGQNVGLGLEYRLTPHWSGHVEAIQLHYQQSDKQAFEPYTFAYAGVAYRF